MWNSEESILTNCHCCNYHQDLHSGKLFYCLLLNLAGQYIFDTAAVAPNSMVFLLWSL